MQPDAGTAPVAGSAKTRMGRAVEAGMKRSIEERERKEWPKKAFSSEQFLRRQLQNLGATESYDQRMERMAGALGGMADVWCGTQGA